MMLPALAKADVGIALGAHGKTASSDVADIVILHNSIKRVSDVVSISKTTIKIANRESGSAWVRVYSLCVLRSQD
jgi:cation transport ATPase